MLLININCIFFILDYHKFVEVNAIISRIFLASFNSPRKTNVGKIRLKFHILLNKYKYIALISFKICKIYKLNFNFSNYNQLYTIDWSVKVKLSSPISKHVLLINTLLLNK